MHIIPESQLQSLGKQYAFRDEVEIKAALREYPLAVQVLLDTHNKIDAYFPGSQIFLEVSIDYEASDQDTAISGPYKRFVISISTALPPSDAMKKLREFYEDWWFKTSDKATNNISIGLEFSPT